MQDAREMGNDLTDIKNFTRIWYEIQGTASAKSIHLIELQEKIE